MASITPPRILPNALRKGIGACALITAAMMGSTLATAPEAQAGTAITSSDIANFQAASAWANNPRVPVVVFGGRLEPGCVIPQMLSLRLNRAALFLRFHPRNPVIVSGGFTRAGCPSEAQAMERALRMRGIMNPIIKEQSSYSTAENARNVAAMWSGSKMIVITGDQHAARASANLRAYGKQTRSITFGG